MFPVHSLALVAEECQVAFGALVGKVTPIPALEADNVLQGLVRSLLTLLARGMLGVVGSGKGVKKREN